MIPIDYHFCRQTVTVYRKKDQKIQRLVAQNCYYNYQDVLRTDVPGRRMERKFLLIMPGSRQQVFPGDLVYDGVGPAAKDIDWALFVPAAVAGLSQVAYAQPWHWDGQIAHVEAGRK